MKSKREMTPVTVKFVPIGNDAPPPMARCVFYHRSLDGAVQSVIADLFVL